MAAKRIFPTAKIKLTINGRIVGLLIEFEHQPEWDIFMIEHGPPLLMFICSDCVNQHRIMIESQWEATVVDTMRLVRVLVLCHRVLPVDLLRMLHSFLY